MEAVEQGSEAVLTHATDDMCAKAFETLLARLRPDLSAPSSIELPTTVGGVFVTWSAPRGLNNHYSLRGCIGTLTPAPIDTSVARYASLAAFYDSRFDPISASEVSKLKVGVSILSCFEEAEDVYDWDIGVHGIVLSVAGYSATYLPEVCAEHSWTKTFCVRNLAKKAGYTGPLHDEDLLSARVTRYQSTKNEMLFEEYMTLIES